jgi:hypothetical protein
MAAVPRAAVTRGRDLANISRRFGGTGSRRAAAQTFALHAPDQQIDTVLSEERLVLEHEGRHAPMAGGRMVLFIMP